MGRKKITNLFPDYIRTGKADLEMLSQLVLRAKGSRSMNDFANECEVNTSTSSRIINMKNKTACSDEVLVAISKAADPSSGVTLEQLLAANGMVKLVPAGTEGVVVTPTQIIFGLVDNAAENEGASQKLLQGAKQYLSEDRLLEYSRESLQNSLLLNGYSVELLPYERLSWPRNRRFMGDFAIRTNALKKEGIDIWLFDCKSYIAGGGGGTIRKMNQLFGMAYMDSPHEHGIKVSVVVDHPFLIEQAREYYAECAIKDYFSFILISRVNRCVIDEFCIPRIDGTEKSVFKIKDRR